MSDIEQLIMDAVNGIWEQHDTDNSGQLDREETKRFIMATLSEAGQEGGEIPDDKFEECFKEYDTDGSGQISKAEMSAFIMKAAGLA